MTEHDAPTESNHTSKINDRAAALGLPPDSGPEQDVMIVHPSLLRGRPFSTTLLIFGPIAIPLLIKFFIAKDMTWTFAGYTILGLVVLAWGYLFFSWLTYSMARSMKVSNKRVIERRGLFSKRSSEVIHEHIRSVTVNQSLLNRIFDTGFIEISTSANQDVEVKMKDVPQPHKFKEVIDLYRDHLD